MSITVVNLCRKFVFADNVWRLYVVRDNKSRCINVELRRISKGSPLIIDYSVSLRTLDGKEDKEHCRCDVKEVSLKPGDYRIVSIQESFVSATEQVPSNVFAVLCTLKHPKSVDDKSGVATAKCSYCKETLNSESISSHEKKCVSKPIKCPKCCDVIPLLKWYEHECQMTKPKDDISLTQVYKNVLLNGKNHDLILKIGEKEFRAHKDILRARSHVFESMLDHDMKEKRTGVIDVSDCDPQAMELFLLYVYCGKLETQDQNNMIGLYYTADKYDMQDLKEECSVMIRRSLSNANICEVIQLALKHSDSRLLENATEYFMSNALDIMHTVEWQIFLKDNTTVGNELLIKSFKKQSCNSVSQENVSPDVSRGPEEALSPDVPRGPEEDPHCAFKDVPPPELEPPPTESTPASENTQSTNITMPASVNEGDPLSFLRTQPPFQQMKQMVQQNPQLLEACLKGIGQGNPMLLQLISQHQESFVRLLNEPTQTQRGNLSQGSDGGASTGTGSASNFTMKNYQK